MEGKFIISIGVIYEIHYSYNNSKWYVLKVKLNLTFDKRGNLAVW